MNLREQTKKLLNSYGVSGNEAEAARVAAEILRPYVDEVVVDPWNNVAGYKRCGRSGAKQVLLDAHLDQIGYMVQKVMDDGMVKFHSINGPNDILPGSELTILTESGPITGVCGWVPPVYREDPKIEAIRPDFDGLFIDTGLTAEEAKEKICVGDLISFGCDAIDLVDDIIAGKSTDDRICFMSLVWAMALLKDDALDVDVVVVGSSKEEFDGSGARARAWADRPDYAICVDVADRTPLFSGPIITIGGDSNPALAGRLEKTAAASGIPYVTRSVGQVSGTNAKHYQVAAYGTVSCVVSHPQKYMHTPVEIVSFRDTENIGKLLAEFLRGFDGTL